MPAVRGRDDRRVSGYEHLNGGRRKRRCRYGRTALVGVALVALSVPLTNAGAQANDDHITLAGSGTVTIRPRAGAPSSAGVLVGSPPSVTGNASVNTQAKAPRGTATVSAQGRSGSYQTRFGAAFSTVAGSNPDVVANLEVTIERLRWAGELRWDGQIVNPAAAPNGCRGCLRGVASADVNASVVNLDSGEVLATETVASPTRVFSGSAPVTQAVSGRKTVRFPSFAITAGVHLGAYVTLTVSASSRLRLNATAGAATADFETRGTTGATGGKPTASTRPPPNSGTGGSSGGTTGTRGVSYENVTVRLSGTDDTTTTQSRCTATEVTPNGLGEAVLVQYFRAIDAHDYAQAFGLLDANLQAGWASAGPGSNGGTNFASFMGEHVECVRVTGITAPSVPGDPEVSGSLGIAWYQVELDAEYLSPFPAGSGKFQPFYKVHADPHTGAGRPPDQIIDIVTGLPNFDGGGGDDTTTTSSTKPKPPPPPPPTTSCAAGSEPAVGFAPDQSAARWLTDDQGTKWVLIRSLNLPQIDPETEALPEDYSNPINQSATWRFTKLPGGTDDVHLRITTPAKPRLDEPAGGQNDTQLLYLTWGTIPAPDQGRIQGAEAHQLRRTGGTARQIPGSPVNDPSVGPTPSNPNGSTLSPEQYGMYTGEVTIPRADLEGGEAGYWVRLAPSDPQQALLPSVYSRVEVAFNQDSVRVCTGDLPTINRSASYSTPTPSVSYNKATKRITTDRSIFVDPATDPDGDGINQKFENAAAALVEPTLVLDALEPPNTRPAKMLVRVAPWPSYQDVRYVIFYYLSAWAYDAGKFGTTIPGMSSLSGDLSALNVGYENHRGDSEKSYEAYRVVDDHTLTLDWVYTSAHDDGTLHNALWSSSAARCNTGNVVAWRNGVTDKGPDDQGAEHEEMCANLEYDASGNVKLFPSRGKHAMYPTAAVCNQVTLVHAYLSVPEGSLGFAGYTLFSTEGLPSLEARIGENCPSTLELLLTGGNAQRLPIVQVGEPGNWLINSLGISGFPKENVWTGRVKSDDRAAFCGGLDEQMVGTDKLGNTVDLAYPSGCSGRLGAKFDAPPPELVNAMTGVAANEASVAVPGGTATVTSSAGIVTDVTYLPASKSPNPPAGVSFPFGKLGFAVYGLSVGKTVTVTITLPSSVSGYWTLQNGTWSQLPAASVSGNRVTLTLTESGGVVSAPGAPGRFVGG